VRLKRAWQKMGSQADCVCMRIHKILASLFRVQAAEQRTAHSWAPPPTVQLPTPYRRFALGRTRDMPQMCSCCTHMLGASCLSDELHEAPIRYCTQLHSEKGTHGPVIGHCRNRCVLPQQWPHLPLRCKQSCLQSDHAHSGRRDKPFGGWSGS